jgi:hypothetical protein
MSRRMAEFMVELYAPRADRAALQARAERARLAAEQVSREGTPVRYVRSIFVPDDETCFLLYEAEHAADVAQAARRACVQFDRVAEALTEATPDETSSRRTPSAIDRDEGERDSGRPRHHPEPTR